MQFLFYTLSMILSKEFEFTICLCLTPTFNNYYIRKYREQND